MLHSIELLLNALLTSHSGKAISCQTILRQPGIEPGSIAWEATMLTITPLTQCDIKLHDDVAFKRIYVENKTTRLRRPNFGIKTRSVWIFLACYCLSSSKSVAPVVGG